MPVEPERLLMIRAGLKRVERECKVLRQQIARAIEEAEATTHTQSEEDTDSDRHTRDT